MRSLRRPTICRRLVLGDWLVQHGDPWGELLLLQCGASTDAARARALTEDTRWMGPLHHPRLHWVFRHGLPVAFDTDGVYRYSWEDEHYVASYAYELRFRGNRQCREELWELTDEDPRAASLGDYELAPWSALRGHGTIAIRMTHPHARLGLSPVNGAVSWGVLRGPELFVRGTMFTQLLQLSA